LISSGVVLAEYLDVIWQDVEYLPEGKVACHLGHLDILKRFLTQSKDFALIFEDDLEPGAASLRQELDSFLSQVPKDFDLLHLGFVRENRDARRPVAGQNCSVFRSVEALGRHAYVVTKKVAKLLVEHTLPMHNHGDKMFQEVYQRFHLKAYQPEEPLFFQDRINFESELTERWKPSRAFQPTAEDDGIRSSDRPEMLRRQQMKQQPTRWSSRRNSALFLNVDGVLNVVDSIFSVSTCGRPEQLQLVRLAKVMQLGCFLVLTSPWRLDERYCGRLASALVRCGIPWATQAISVTPDGRGHGTNQVEERLMEIGAWIESNPWLQQWAIVDCLDLLSVDATIHEQFVRTDPTRGLLDEHVEELSELFANE